MVYDFLGILLFLLVCPVKHVCGKKERRKKRKQLIDGHYNALYPHCTDTVPTLYRDCTDKIAFFKNISKSTRSLSNLSADSESA
jgi:hypothetical protein